MSLSPPPLKRKRKKTNLCRLVIGALRDSERPVRESDRDEPLHELELRARRLELGARVEKVHQELQ